MAAFFASSQNVLYVTWKSIMDPFYIITMDSFWAHNFIWFYLGTVYWSPFVQDSTLNTNSKVDSTLCGHISDDIFLF